MSEIKWGLIDNGTTFESLVSVLIRHKDSKARIYERSGPDAGIDAKSGDGKTVYQVKYIRDSDNFSSIITRAKKELEKIKEYKDPKHKNYIHWAEVEKWCLITNGVWNITDDELKWQNDIQKPFQNIGLKVELQHKTDLNEYLRRFPNVKSEYFEGENRVLQSLSEAIETFKDDIILSKGFNPQLIEGRTKELKHFSDFIQSKNERIICIHGSGGVGKTRLAIEAAYQANDKEGYDIFWANTATLEKNNNWFRSISYNRKALLIIDEPKQQQSIESLIEQARSSKLVDWKFVIITRTSKDHILEPLNDRRLQIVATPIEVQPLNEQEARTFISNLIENSQKLKNRIANDDKRKLCDYLVNNTGGFPIWIIIAIHLLEKDGNIGALPQGEFGLAQKYLDEILSSPPQTLSRIKFIKYIKAIAILQPVYIKDDPHLQSYFKILLNDSQMPELEDVFNVLIEKNFAVTRGRLLEIKPDVIRDYIIFKLIGDNESESKEWFQNILKIEKENPSKMKSALIQLAKLALYQRHQEKQEKTFFDEIWTIFSERVKQGSLDDQYSILDIATDISFANPMLFLDLIKQIKLNKKQNESTKWTNKYTSHDNLILQLPQAIYESSRYINNETEAEDFFKELIDLSKKESPLIKGTYSYLENDGHRTIPLIEGLMKDHHPKKGFYKEIILNWVIQKINNINTLKRDEATLLEEVTKEFLKIERHDTYVEGWNLICTKILINPRSKEQIYRNQILKKIWSLLTSNKVNITNRKLLWKLLDTYHSQSKIHSDPQKQKDKKHCNYWAEELENHFHFLKEYLSQRDIEISEIRLLRSIWDWHLKYDNREKFKKYAQECEKLVEQKNNDYIDIKSLFGQHQDYAQRESIVKEYILKHDLRSSEKIRSFINNCFNYDNESFKFIIQTIAQQLENCSKLKPYIFNYVNEIFANKEFNHHFQFSCEIIFAHLINLKQDEEDSFNFIMTYWQKLNTLEQKECFLRQVLYSHFKSIKYAIKGNIKFVSEILPELLNDNNPSKSNYDNCVSYISNFLGVALFSNFDQSNKLIHSILKKTPSNKTYNIFSQYIAGVSHRTFFLQDFPSTHLPEKIFLWLINLLNYVPSIHNGQILWNDLIKIKSKLRTKFTVIDFINIIKERLTLLERKNDSLWEHIFLQRDFLKIVDPVHSTDVTYKKAKPAFKKLLKFNGRIKYLLHYSLPRIAATLDPEGIFIPSMICEKIQEKIFLCDPLENIPRECEWTRYAGCYAVNSKPWRKIATVACEMVSEKPTAHQVHIFSDLLSYGIETFTGTPGKVPDHFYNKVKEAKMDLNQETDSNIKKFMEWRLKIAQNSLKEEKLRVSEENR